MAGEERTAKRHNSRVLNRRRDCHQICRNRDGGEDEPGEEGCRGHLRRLGARFGLARTKTERTVPDYGRSRSNGDVSLLALRWGKASLLPSLPSACALRLGLQRRTFQQASQRRGVKIPRPSYRAVACQIGKLFRSYSDKRGSFFPRMDGLFPRHFVFFGVQLLGCTPVPTDPPRRRGFPRRCICPFGGAGEPRRYEERIAKRKQKSRRNLNVLRSRREKEGNRRRKEAAFCLEGRTKETQPLGRDEDALVKRGIGRKKTNRRRSVECENSHDCSCIRGQDGRL